MRGEGAITNIAQLCDLLEAFADAGREVPLTIFIDDSCSTRISLMTELVLVAKGGDNMRQKLKWTVLLLCAIDIQVDGLYVAPSHGRARAPRP